MTLEASRYSKALRNVDETMSSLLFAITTGILSISSEMASIEETVVFCKG